MSQRVQRMIRLGQECLLALMLLKLQWRSKYNMADHRHRQEFSFGQDPIQVGKIYRHKLHVGPLAPQMVNATLEGGDVFSAAARAFRKDDERVPSAQRTQQHLERMARGLKLALTVVRSGPLHQHGAKDADGNPVAQSGLPIIFRRDRACEFPQLFGQDRPQHDEVKMASVVGEVDALARIGFRADPAHGSAREQSRSSGDRAGQQWIAQRASSPRTILMVRRAIVTMQPAITIMRAIQSSVPVRRNLLSMIESKHAPVINAMRCCLAIGPMKLCASPDAPPSMRTYAVKTASSAAIQPSSMP